MSDLPLVSIIVNNYNYDRFLSKAIDSALEQTYPNIEVIVVDDGSTDGSRDIMAGYGDRILALFQANGKQGAAFNNGFLHSKGEIIVFLDSDDYLFPTAIEQIVAVWKPGIAKVHYRLLVVDENERPYGYSYPQGRKLTRGNLQKVILNIGTYVGVPTSGNALTRCVLTQVMPIPQEYNTTADDYLSVLMPLYGEVVAIDEPLAAYRLHTRNQYAMANIEMFNGDRFRRFMYHSDQRCALLQQKGKELGLEVPADLEIRFFGRVWSRLASLKLDPANHPIPDDRPLLLMKWGIEALWKYSEYNWQKRLIFSLWFVWVGLMPRSLAKPAIVWLFAPQFRPQIVGKTLNKIRQIVS